MFDIHSRRDSLDTFSQMSERTPVHSTFHASIKKQFKVPRTLKDFGTLIKPTPFQKKNLGVYGSFSNQISYSKQHPVHVSFPSQQFNTEPDPSLSCFYEESTSCHYLTTCPEEITSEASKSILKKGRKSRFSRAVERQTTSQSAANLKVTFINKSDKWKLNKFIQS